ncbi:MAG: alpha/beta fold hydrolase [Pseudomonadota bacterium]
MAMLDRDGVRIYFEFHQGDAQRPTVLLSHGYSATSAMWEGQLDALTKICNLITWDMRGHGQSDSPADPTLYSEAHTVGDMAAILDACGVAQAVIGGLSLGGYMTLAFHATYPDRCLALMLFDTGPGYKNATARQGWNDTAEARAKAFETEGLAALGAGNEVRVAQHTSAQGLALAARGMLAQVDDRVIQSLPDITLPTLVLVGEDDTPFRVPSDYMAAKIPGASKVVLPAAGHAANIDQPAAFNAAVTTFLMQSLGD